MTATSAPLIAAFLHQALIAPNIRTMPEQDLAAEFDDYLYRLRERFLQAIDTARALLADFRQVEQNFRDLDRRVRERVAGWEGSRADVLEEVFGQRDSIAESDQGRSFRAFWDFLMSPAHQGELSELLECFRTLNRTIDRQVRDG